MLEFCKRNRDKKIYIYGNGLKGSLMYQYLKDNGIAIEGFIVSDHEKSGSDQGIAVYNLSDIEDSNIAVILGLGYKYYNDVVPDIAEKGIHDIYFLNGAENYSALQAVDTWFSVEHENENEMYLGRDFSYREAMKIYAYLRDKGMVLESAIELGAGSGAWLKAFKDSAGESAEILGLDGSSYGREGYLQPKEFIKCDLQSISVEDIISRRGKRYDLSISTEVAEHLSEKCAQQFIANLCAGSDRVLFSAAIPYQGGNHHINEKRQSYWRDIFIQQGYRPIDCIRPHFWSDSEIDCMVRQNMILYVKQELFDDDIKRFDCANIPFDVVHPEVFEMKMKLFQEGILFN